MRLSAIVSVLTVAAIAYGCGTSNSSSSAPSCADLQKQINACTNISQAGKDSLAPFCATASEDCRSCLDGTLCGVTEQCDPQCKKSEADSGKPPPSCSDLQTQINGCSNISQGTKDSFGAFCGSVSTACRSCLDGDLCGVTEQCDSVCGKTADGGREGG
ncbi:MAG: hypothetical protein JWP97_3766 [Labilithrix sp.]|nr:hypothetical protein [Labilithrix sp.]